MSKMVEYPTIAMTNKMTWLLDMFKLENMKISLELINQNVINRNDHKEI